MTTPTDDALEEEPIETTECHPAPEYREEARLDERERVRDINEAMRGGVECYAPC